MEAAYSPINNSHTIQRIVCPKKSIKKDKSIMKGTRMIKHTNMNGDKVLRKFLGYII